MLPEVIVGPSSLRRLRIFKRVITNYQYHKWISDKGDIDLLLTLKLNKESIFFELGGYDGSFMPQGVRKQKLNYNNHSAYNSVSTANISSSYTTLEIYPCGSNAEGLVLKTKALMSSVKRIAIDADTFLKGNATSPNAIESGSFLQDGMLKTYALPKETEDQIVLFVDEYKRQLREISLRTVLKIADLAKAFPENWKEMAKNTVLRPV